MGQQPRLIVEDSFNMLLSMSNSLTFIGLLINVLPRFQSRNKN